MVIVEQKFEEFLFFLRIYRKIKKASYTCYTLQTPLIVYTEVCRKLRVSNQTVVFLKQLMNLLKDNFKAFSKSTINTTGKWLAFMMASNLSFEESRVYFSKSHYSTSSIIRSSRDSISSKPERISKKTG